MRYSNCNLNRRDFVRAIGAATLGAGPVFAGGRPLDLLSPGIKISLQIPGDFTAEDLVFARQLGVEYVSIPTRGGTYETFARHMQRVEAAGLKVANIGNANVHNMPEVTLNLLGRDQKIEEYKQYLRDLARAGIFYTTYAHMGNGIWSSQRENDARRRGCPRLPPRDRQGLVEWQDLRVAADSRPQVHQGRAVG